jgi:hypothetical protein
MIEIWVTISFSAEYQILINLWLSPRRGINRSVKRVNPTSSSLGSTSSTWRWHIRKENASSIEKGYVALKKVGTKTRISSNSIRISCWSIFGIKTQIMVQRKSILDSPRDSTGGSTNVRATKLPRALFGTQVSIFSAETLSSSRSS